jgi:hypothetical protein
MYVDNLIDGHFQPDRREGTFTTSQGETIEIIANRPIDKRFNSLPHNQEERIGE